MSLPMVFMFSGQGSQYYHMGKALYENNSRFRYWMNRCSLYAEPIIKTSLIEQLYSTYKRDVPFDRLLYTNPALVSVEVSLAKMLIEQDCYPDYLLGYSLGEITASIVSDAIDLDIGIQMVAKLASLAEKKCQVVNMLMIMSPLTILEEMPEVFEACQVTGNNFPGSFVVSGLPDDILRVKRIMEEKKLIVQLLPVKYGFHTHLIDVIEQEFTDELNKVKMNNCKIPVISALEAKILTQPTADYVWKVIRNPIEFARSVEWMLNKGDYQFIDVGPSGSLATFVKYILPENSQSSTLMTLSPYGKDVDMMNKFYQRLGLTSLA